MQKNTEIAELLTDVKEQIIYLRELGVEAFDVQIPEVPSSKFKVQNSKPIEKFVSADLSSIPVFVPKVSAQKPTDVSRLSKMPSLTKRAAPVPTVQLQNGEPIQTPTKAEIIEPQTTPVLFEEKLPDPVETIESIRADIGSCTRCPLHTGRTQVVHSSGNFQADLMFVGEAPGADEDEQGFPFVGRAGQLLTKIIEGIGMKREDVFIGNINRCRPPGNRQPTLPEAETCRPFLLREIAVVRPKVIVVMGNTALHNLLETKIGITKLRGEFQDYFGVRVMPTFHPAYLLRDPRKKREVWEDMKKVRDYLSSH